MNIDRFSLVLAASTLASTATAEQADLLPPDRTYELSVVTADGGTFADCATFRGDHALVLQAARGLVVDWLRESTDPSERRFHAVTDGSRQAANPIGLALHGTFVDRNTIRGDGINDLGLTFTFSGRVNRACAAAATYGGDENPYAAAPATPVQFEPADASVAGRLYAVQLYGAEMTEDCLRFIINGTLAMDGGVNLLWGMDRMNEGLGTFQAVGPNAGGGAGLALRGELTAWNELRVHGVRNDAVGLREIVGSGRETGNCIDD